MRRLNVLSEAWTAAEISTSQRLSRLATATDIIPKKCLIPFWDSFMKYYFEIEWTLELENACLMQVSVVFYTKPPRLLLIKTSRSQNGTSGSNGTPTNVQILIYSSIK